MMKLLELYAWLHDTCGMVLGSLIWIGGWAVVSFSLFMLGFMVLTP